MGEIWDLLNGMNQESTCRKGGVKRPQNNEHSAMLPLACIKKEFAEAYEKVLAMNPRVTNEPISTDAAVEMKRQGRYIESNRMYAQYVMKHKLLTPMLAMAWYKTLASAGDITDALKIVDYLASRNPPMCYATNMLQMHAQGLRELIAGGNFDEIRDYLASISGNPHYQIARESIDIFSENNAAGRDLANESVPASIPENVQNAYFTILQLVDSMTSALSDVYKVSQSDKEREVTANQLRMDAILEAILLHVALAKDSLSIEEQRFIDSITLSKGIFHLMQADPENRYRFSMQEVAAMPPFKQQAFLAVMDEWIQIRILPKVIPVFAAFDAVSQKSDRVDFCKYMCRCVTEIVAYAAALDGQLDMSERNAYSFAIFELLHDPWIQERERFMQGY